MASVSMLALPYAARSGETRAREVAKKVSLVFVGLGIVYWGLVLPLRVEVFHLLYKGAYAAVIVLLPWFAVMSLLNSALNGPLVMLRGLNLPKSVFVARAVGAALSIAIGIPATYLYGLRGATAGVILASLFTFAIGQFLLNRRLHSQKSAGVLTPAPLTNP
jgi:O-antigen/teichoic acid export membrane protein